MRIRTIHPAFWTSETVAGLDWETRLLFIGLWSYVDDNGVGRDVTKLVCADLFPLEDDPRETLATVSRGLQTLSDRDFITRYSVENRAYLHIKAWDRWQRVDRPTKARYPLPTCGNATTRDTLATPSRQSRDTLAPGEGEKGRRVEGEKLKNTRNASAAHSLLITPTAHFEDFWDAYPRKVDKARAKRSWTTAARKADPQTIIAAAHRYATEVRDTEPKFVKHPSTWLNAEAWDNPPALAAVPNGHRPETPEERDRRLNPWKYA